MGIDFSQWRQVIGTFTRNHAIFISDDSQNYNSPTKETCNQM